MKIKRENTELVHERKKVKRVMLARQPMYLLIPRDYRLFSIASSFPLVWNNFTSQTVALLHSVGVFN